MRNPLWVAMDTANLLIASDDVRVRALQDVSWNLINVYLSNLEMAAVAGEGRLRDLCVQTAKDLFDSSLNNGVVELVVATIMHLREGAFDGLVETLHAAGGWYEGSKSRDRSGPWYSTWPTVNKFLPLTGRPIRGVIGIQYPQGPIEKFSEFAVAAAIERAEERNLWTVGECDCCERNETGNRLISVPCAARSGFNKDNRLYMEHIATGGDGRPLFCSTPAMPTEAVQAMCGGVGVAGTCLTCGELVFLGTVTEEESGSRGTTTAVAPMLVDSSVRPTAAMRGERRGRGWRRFRNARLRVRRRRHFLPCVCHPLRLSDDIFSCTCLHGHHPRDVDRTSADGYVDNTDELERGGGLSGDGLGGLMTTGVIVFPVPSDCAGWACGDGGAMTAPTGCGDDGCGAARAGDDDAFSCFNLLCAIPDPYPLPNPSQIFLRGGGIVVSVPTDCAGGACGEGGAVTAPSGCGDDGRGAARACVDAVCSCLNLFCAIRGPYPLPNPSQMFLRGGGLGGGGWPSWAVGADDGWPVVADVGGGYDYLGLSGSSDAIRSGEGEDGGAGAPPSLARVTELMARLGEDEDAEVESFQPSAEEARTQRSGESEGFLDWILIIFPAELDGAQKKDVVEEFLGVALAEGILRPLAGFQLNEAPAGLELQVPVRACSLNPLRWTSTSGVMIRVTKIPLAEAPGAIRVGLVVSTGIPRWGEDEAGRLNAAVTALTKAIPASIHWDLGRRRVTLTEMRQKVGCVEIFTDEKASAEALRAVFRPMPAGRGELLVGGVWDAGGRAIPIFLQPKEARGEVADAWAAKACLYVLDTRFLSWSHDRVVSVLLHGAGPVEASLAGVEQALHIPLRMGGTKPLGSTAGSLGEIDVFRFAGENGQTTRVWLVSMSRLYAEALRGELLSSKREQCATWDVDIMRPEALLAEGERLWGRHFRARHASRTPVLGAGEGHPALVWAMMERQARSLAGKAPPAQRGGGAGPGQRPSGRRRERDGGAAHGGALGSAGDGTGPGGCLAPRRARESGSADRGAGGEPCEGQQLDQRGRFALVGRGGGTCGDGAGGY